MKVIKSLENRGILLKGTTRKITSQEEGFLRTLMTAVLPLIKSVLIPLAKSVLIPLGLSPGMSAADTAIQKKIYGSGRPSDLALRTTSLILSNEEMEDIMKKVKSLEESGLLIREIIETIKNEAKEQIGEFISLLLVTLAASLLGSALSGREVTRAGEGVIRAGQNL